MRLPRMTLSRKSAMETLALFAAFALPFLLPALAAAQGAAADVSAQTLPSVDVSIGGGSEPRQLVGTLKILGLLTILAVAPGILVTMTSFTRIVVVLAFVRQALGTQNVPPMQILLGLALLMTAVVMTPVAGRIQEEALGPYMDEDISEELFFERSAGVMRDFLLPQTRESDLALFYEATETPPPETEEEVSMIMLVPAFLISELRTGFEMGFLLFLPFVLVDLVAASILTAMGMVMLPPTMVSTPLKILLFVVVDGWGLLTRSLIASFG